MQPATIIKAGDPVLTSSSTMVTNFGSKELYDLIEYLFYNLEYYNGAGIAAPQIGENKRIFVYGFAKNPRYPEVESIEKTVLINPNIYSFSEEKNDFYEGCLSLPNLRGLVSRSTNIRLKAQTKEGNILDKAFNGFEARIIQHEIDHLNGILFPMKMSDLSTLKYI